jgi:hypothetical protein
MKKSIVLLITLLFISILSVLILKNMDDSQKLIKSASFDKSISQVLVTIENINQEIPRFLQKNKDNIDDILAQTSVLPFNFNNVDILLNISEYTPKEFNLNHLPKDIRSNSDFLNNVGFSYEFFQIVNNHKYTNQREVDQVIDQYIYQTNDTNILNIKDKFGFIDDKNVSTLIECDYSINVDDINLSASLIFDLNSSQVKAFDVAQSTKN